MSFLQKLGLNRCAPVYQSHTLLRTFANPRLTTFCEALQQYVDSFTGAEIDEHWLLLRDRYAGYDWAKLGAVKAFEDHANGLGQRLFGEFVTNMDNMPSIGEWRRQSVYGFRHYEISGSYPAWLETPEDGKVNVRGIVVPAGYLDVLAQFKFLWIAGAVKSSKERVLVAGLKVRQGR